MAPEPETEMPPAEPSGSGVAPATEPEHECPRCGRRLPGSAFNRSGTGRQWWCRMCFKAYYREDRERHRARNDALLTRRVTEAQAHVDRLLLASACKDCGEADPSVLDFDHIAEKRRGICTMVRRDARLSALDAEIAKCEVVCANCHRRRTASRASWRRLDLGEARGFRSRASELNMLHAYCALLASGCVDCGSLDLCTLEFSTICVTRQPTSFVSPIRRSASGSSARKSTSVSYGA